MPYSVHSSPLMLTYQELLGMARWIPPWRHPAKLLEEQEEGEALAETARRYVTHMVLWTVWYVTCHVVGMVR